MARVKLSEYKAKQILLGETYAGVQLRSGGRLTIPEGDWVAKVDQGIKKRMKQGLVVMGKSSADTIKAIQLWEEKGFSQFILEPLFPHDASEEQYFSLERVRDGVRMLHARDGGIDIEAHPEAVQIYLLRDENDIAAAAQESGIPQEFLISIYASFNTHFFAFLEVNPLVIRDGRAHLLDAAALVDSAASFFVRSWKEEDVVKSKAKHPVESHVEAVAATTAASLRLNVLNEQGSLFFLLSGGGGSIVIADEAQLQGMGKKIGNYGEYSGGPTREETYLYAKEVLDLLLGSRAKKKVLIIAGGVANFTDVHSTFLGIIDALSECASDLREVGVRVFVRRGGPNEAAGLGLMKEFLEKENLLGAVYGSDALITSAVSDALDFVRV